MKCKRCHRRKAVGIIRGQEVCDGCYNTINKDNYFRIKEGKSIPRDFKMFIEIDKNGKLIGY